jgi:E3 ubiquitin-protein ligase UHRF1
VCAKCRSSIPSKIASHPRINSQLAIAIRLAKLARSEGIRENIDISTKNAHCFMHNDDRPNTAFTTERAKKAGKANACCGKIFVTIPSDHFGPILAEHDPIRNRGVVVGDIWSDRMECRQWGAHFPHVAGIAGQSNHGSQSVALSGGYIDDEDHGEWFLYTGSGGRDLSGNKRINKQHSFDQIFDYMNEALRISCLKGYPVRVVRFVFSFLSII